MTYLLTFLEGFASFISPCILPLVPLYIVYFSGTDSKGIKKALLNSISFVLGFTLIFVLMAVLASSLGSFIASNTKYIKYIFGAFSIIFGLAYLDLIKLKFLNSSQNLKFDLNNLNVIRSFIFGILFSISHTPCIGYFIGSALMLVMNEKDIINGIILMVLYSFGLGIPFIISAILIDKLKTVFNFIKKNFKYVKIVSGILLIISGLFLIFS